jgi:hypothetical protein
VLWTTRDDRGATAPVLSLGHLVSLVSSSDFKCKVTGLMVRYRAAAVCLMAAHPDISKNGADGLCSH